MKNFSRPPFFPLMIDIKDREILIVGGGRVASRRAETLLRCGARVTAVSKDFIQDFPSDVIKIERSFHPSDIDERFLFVVAAVVVPTLSPENQLVSIEPKSFFSS